MSLSLSEISFDPRTLILLSLCFAFLVISFSSLQFLFCLFVFSVCLAALFKVPFFSTMKKMLLIDGFMVFALLSLPFTFASGSFFLVLGFPFYWDGLLLAIAILLKANSIFLCFTALMGRMGLAEFAHALSHLNVPSSFVQILLFMVRYVDVLKLELQRMLRTMKCRGFRYSTSWHCWKSIGHLIGMLFVRSIERAEQILIAMKCRGFTGTFPLLHHFHYSMKDTVLVSTFIAFLIVFLSIGFLLDGSFLKVGI